MSEQDMQHEAMPDTEPSPWGELAAEAGLDFEQVEGVDFEPFAEQQQADTQQQAAALAATDTEKLAAAEVIIRGALKFVVSALYGLDVPDSKYDELAGSTAAVIVKHYRGGIFEFMARWREEIAMVAALMAFVAALREASNAKKAKDVTPPKPEHQQGGGDAEPT